MRSTSQVGQLLLIENAKSKGAQKVEVSMGYIANEKLMNFLEKELLMVSRLWEKKLFEEIQIRLTL